MDTTNAFHYQKRNIWAGILFGIGFGAFVDEMVFHQLLHWHHFYDQSTLGVGLFSDGILHAFSWFATVSSLFLLSDLRRRHAWWRKKWLGGWLLGAGLFQLYDGIIHHKVMRLHQVRYNVELFPYDLAWNAAGLVAVLIGAILIFSKTRKKEDVHG